jgi:hypothetical protein
MLLVKKLITKNLFSAKAKNFCTSTKNSPFVDAYNVAHVQLSEDTPAAGVKEYL